MEQTLSIDGKKYNLLYKGKTASIYRDCFNRDLLVDIQEVQIKFGEAIEKMFVKEILIEILISLYYKQTDLYFLKG